MKYTKIHASMHSDICEHLELLYSLVLGLKAKLVIELGIRTGQSTVALLEAVHETKGRLISVDTDHCEDAVRMINSYKLSDCWSFVQDDDIEFGSRWNGDPTDLIFIDTSHEYSHTKKEIEIFERLLRPGGLMVFHDTVSFHDGVYVPIQEFLSTRSSYRFDNRTNCNGLGIITKPLT